MEVKDFMRIRVPVSCSSRGTQLDCFAFKLMQRYLSHMFIFLHSIIHSTYVSLQELLCFFSLFGIFRAFPQFPDMNEKAFCRERVRKLVKKTGENGVCFRTVKHVHVAFFFRNVSDS